MKRDYHNHLKYCKHADLEAMDIADEYVKRGFVELGYSDHVPYPEPWDAVDSGGKARMKLEELPNYLKDIDEVIKKYGSKLKVWKGLESEYFPTHKWWFEELLTKRGVDYLILGIHVVEDLSDEDNNFNRNCTSPRQIKKYWKAFEEGMNTGYYLYAVHPDFYMKSYEVWDDDCNWLAHKICKMAKEQDFALGFNINGFWKGPRMIGDSFRNKYPIKEFWDIAKEYGVKIILESDVHHKKQLYDNDVIDNVYKLLKEWKIEHLLIESLDIEAYRKTLLKKIK